MQVLIAYGSKRGGTEGLAEMIETAMAGTGVQAVVKPAARVKSLDGFDAVVIAGSLYASRWHRDARRFAKRHVKALRERPVWLVSSGPLDESAAERDIPPVKQVAAVMASLGARGHVTFGGRLAPDAKGFPASAMAKTKSGDWRNPAHVNRWVAAVVDELAHPAQPG